MDVKAKLRDLLSAKGWTSYRLAKESGLSQSTIINIYKRSSVPSVDTLEAICKGFGITLSQFFTEGESVELTPELKEVFEGWAKLTPDEKELVLNMIKTLNKKQKPVASAIFMSLCQICQIVCQIRDVPNMPNHMPISHQRLQVFIDVQDCRF